jgi:hypothetical protein
MRAFAPLAPERIRDGRRGVSGIDWGAGLRVNVIRSGRQRRNPAMRKAFKNTALALGLSGAIALAATTPLSAAPVPSATLAMKASAPDHTTPVYWRGRWGWGGGLLAAGLAAGFVGAAATAAYGGYYPYPAYAYPAPAYVYPAYPAYPAYPMYSAYPAYPVAPYYYARPYWGGYGGRPYW